MRRNEVMLEETRDTITVPASLMIRWYPNMFLMNLPKLHTFHTLRIRMLASLNQIRRGKQNTACTRLPDIMIIVIITLPTRMKRPLKFQVRTVPNKRNKNLETNENWIYRFLSDHQINKHQIDRKITQINLHIKYKSQVFVSLAANDIIPCFFGPSKEWAWKTYLILVEFRIVSYKTQINNKPIERISRNSILKTKFIDCKEQSILTIHSIAVVRHCWFDLWSVIRLHPFPSIQAFFCSLNLYGKRLSKTLQNWIIQHGKNKRRDIKIEHFLSLPNLPCQCWGI